MSQEPFWEGISLKENFDPSFDFSTEALFLCPFSLYFTKYKFVWNLLLNEVRSLWTFGLKWPHKQHHDTSPKRLTGDEEKMPTLCLWLRRVSLIRLYLISSCCLTFLEIFFVPKRGGNSAEVEGYQSSPWYISASGHLVNVGFETLSIFNQVANC